MDQPRPLRGMVMSVPHEWSSLLVANARKIQKTINGEGIQAIPIGSRQLPARGKTIVELAELKKDFSVFRAPEIVSEMLSLRTANCVTHVVMQLGMKTFRIRCEVNDPRKGFRNTGAGDRRRSPEVPDDIGPRNRRIFVKLKLDESDKPPCVADHDLAQKPSFRIAHGLPTHAFGEGPVFQFPLCFSGVSGIDHAARCYFTRKCA